jgi:hypothetical protein
MSRVYDALKKLEADRSRAATPSATPAAGVDAIRLEQFVDLQQRMLLAGARGPDLAERLVHGVATFLDVPGAAVGVVDGHAYRLLGTYGVGYEDRARHECAALEESELAPVLTSGRPLVRRHPDADGATRREVVLPIRGAITGALHLTMPEGSGLSDEKVSLGRLMASLVGVALANART